MRQVVGRRTFELSPAELGARRADHDGLLLDVGTGDGKHVLAVARARPGLLVVGLDAGPDAMRPTAARAAQKPAKGGVPNALFVWGAVEALPDGLDGVTELHSLMPWGSLLRAFVTPDPTILESLGARCVPGAQFLLTINLHAWRPPVPEVGTTPEPTVESALSTLAPSYASAGWTIDSATYPGADELADLGTSWTKRLGSTRDDLAVLALSGTIGHRL
ncbi:class I SAM-dependent methyltransferase [Jatrophihabitans endophyticus]|uniref:class I SAM-dependent methyltransferase n=1 Tax=Jatrophihabitans endophyticus TaxID=1206085 RepID=UPI0019DC27B6|nr:class I SAM-dependent methyltransferase [Jatrophihabitans endophyticus]MBE7188103.1 hypothetical protein [Jatrophihabitans endophyticus]